MTAILDIEGFLNATCRARINDDVTLYFDVNNTIYLLTLPRISYHKRSRSTMDFSNMPNRFTFKLWTCGARR